MSLVRKSFTAARRVAAPAALAIAGLFSAANANAEHTIGTKCRDAETVKKELADSGYTNLYVYRDNVFYEPTGDGRKQLVSIYASQDLKQGYHVVRAGESGKYMCVVGELRDIKPADSLKQERSGKINPVFLAAVDSSDSRHMNELLRRSVKTGTGYPILQADYKTPAGVQYKATWTMGSQEVGTVFYADKNFFVDQADPRIETKGGAASRLGFTPFGAEVVARSEQNILAFGR